MAAGPTRQPHLPPLSSLFSLLSSLLSPLSDYRRLSPARTSRRQRSSSSPGPQRSPAAELQLAHSAALHAAELELAPRLLATPLLATVARSDAAEVHSAAWHDIPSSPRHTSSRRHDVRTLPPPLLLSSARDGRRRTVRERGLFGLLACGISITAVAAGGGHGGQGGNGQRSGGVGDQLHPRLTIVT
jgi:hypothetical protein